MSQEEVGFQRALATAVRLGGCSAIMTSIRRSWTTATAIQRASEAGGGVQADQSVGELFGLFRFRQFKSAPIGYRNIRKNHRDWFVSEKGLFEGSSEEPG